MPKPIRMSATENRNKIIIAISEHHGSFDFDGVNKMKFTESRKDSDNRIG